MTQIIEAKTAAVSTPVEFTVFRDKGTLQMSTDPGASGAFTILLKGNSTTLLTLDTNTDPTTAELTLNPGTYTVTKTASSNSCGLDCVGLFVNCQNPG